MMSRTRVDWDRTRRQWQASVTAPDTISLAELKDKDRALRNRIRRRDLVETVAAAIVAVIFGIDAWKAVERHDGLVAVFGIYLVLWAVWVPLRLHHSRRLLTALRPDLPLRDYLVHHRDVLLAQARMLERAWLWYVVPCVVGMIGLNLSRLIGDLPMISNGVVMTVVWIINSVVIAGIIALGVGIAWINRQGARKFRVQAEQLDRQLAQLVLENDK